MAVHTDDEAPVTHRDFKAWHIYLVRDKRDGKVWIKRSRFTLELFKRCTTIRKYKGSRNFDIVEVDCVLDEDHAIKVARETAIEAQKKGYVLKTSLNAFKPGFPSRNVGAFAKQYHCSVCHQLGHTKPSCPKLVYTQR